MDTDLGLQMERAELVLDAGVGDRGRLEAVPERLVHDLDAPWRRHRRIVADVPVVDEILLPDFTHDGSASTTIAIPCPPPMQADATPQRFFRRRSS